MSADQSNDIAFQRVKHGDATGRKAELRCEVPIELLQMLDAVAQAQNKDSRAEVVIPVLQRFVDEELHRATLLLRMARINPLLPDAAGSRAE